MTHPMSWRLPEAAPLATMARDLEHAARRLDRRLAGAVRAPSLPELDQVLGTMEQRLPREEARGIALWRRVLGDPVAPREFDHFMERPSHVGTLERGAMAVLREADGEEPPTSRAIVALMGAFVELDDAVRRIAARLPLNAPAEAGLSPEEGDAFGHAVDVIVPALEGRGAEVLPFEPGFEDDAVRGAERQNARRDGRVAVPVQFLVGSAQVPAVVRGTGEELAAVLENALAIGARPALRADLLRRAGLPPKTLPLDLLERLLSGSRGEA